MIRAPITEGRKSMQPGHASVYRVHDQFNDCKVHASNTQNKCKLCALHNCTFPLEGVFFSASTFLWMVRQLLNTYSIRGLIKNKKNSSSLPHDHRSIFVVFFEWGSSQMIASCPSSWTAALSCEKQKPNLCQDENHGETKTYNSLNDVLRKKMKRIRHKLSLHFSHLRDLLIYQILLNKCHCQVRTTVHMWPLEWQMKALI